MIACLDTSTPTCYLSFIDGDYRHDANWQAGRELSKGLLGFVERELELQDKSWGDIRGLVVFKGPGSFTGLRIGITVWNTLADARDIPIVGVANDSPNNDWRQVGATRLQNGENDKIVLPNYGAEANITKPRK